MTEPVLIRPLTTIEDLAAAEAVQRAVWPGTDLDVVPTHLLLTAAHNGGLVLGAFAGGQMIGFLFGFLGTDEADPQRPAMTRLKHCSHMTGVLAGHRDRDVGYQLKLAQREFVTSQGVRLVTWTFDPLESRNARLNIARLGAVSRIYKRNVYGTMADSLNAGLPSDRLQVDWWVTSARVRERLEGSRAALDLGSFLSAGGEILNPSEVAPDDGLPRPAHAPRRPDGLFAIVEIPADIQAVKAHDMILARDWRLQTRELFEAAFAAGYLITDFLSEPVDGRRRSFYALSRTDPTAA